MKVRKGSVYVFVRSGFDLLMPMKLNVDLKDDMKVRVIQAPGCPPPNSMGHCHVETLDGTFIGLVSTESLKGPLKGDF